MNTMELLAPAGSIDALHAAFSFGADAVYIGGDRFGARAYADNPDQKDLLEAIRLSHRLGKRLYLTVNTLVKDAELDALRDWLRPFYEEGLDAAIVQDMGVVSLLREDFPSLPIHASTQMLLTGSYGAGLLKELGVVRVIPARELSLAECQAIREKTGLELEVFVHGAMCYSYSGACLISSLLGGRSGNRGRCAGVCRMPFCIDGERPGQKLEAYPMNMKDLCAIRLLPALASAGVCSLKIEGRMKKPEYTAGVVDVYRRALDRMEEGITPFVTAEEEARLLALYNRDGFTEGYFYAHNGADMIAYRNEKLQESRSAAAQEEMNRIRRIREEQGNAPLQVPITGRVILHEQEPARLVLSAEDLRKGRQVEATVSGAVLEKATAHPVTAERVAEQLKKTGNMSFSFRELQIEMDDDLFIPMQVLNGLRREGCNALEEKWNALYARKNDTPPVCPDKDTMPEDRTPAGTGRSSHERGSFDIRCEVHSEEQCRAVLQEKDVTGLYLPFPLWKVAGEVRQSGKAVFLALPYILREKDSDWFSELEQSIQEIRPDGILLRNLEEVGWAAVYQAKHKETTMEWLTDALVYTMNMRAVRQFAAWGMPRRTLPYELQFLELCMQETKGSEIVLYGRTPLMLSAQCPDQTSGQCTHRPGWRFLTDRKKIRFPVYRMCSLCQTVLYNSVPTDLSSEQDAVRRLQCASGRLCFTTETAEDVQRICRRFLADAPQTAEGESHTKGHFRRGVE